MNRVSWDSVAEERDTVESSVSCWTAEDTTNQGGHAVAILSLMIYGRHRPDLL